MIVNRARTPSSGPLITSFRVQSSSWFSFTPDPPPLPPWVSPDLVRPFCYFLHSPTFLFNSIQNPSLVYVGAAEILPIVDSDLRKIATRVVDSARQLCIDKSVISFLTFFCHRVWFILYNLSSLVIRSDYFSGRWCHSGGCGRWS